LAAGGDGGEGDGEGEGGEGAGVVAGAGAGVGFGLGMSVCFHGCDGVKRDFGVEGIMVGGVWGWVAF
jgi:hypothetical protein